MRRSFPETHREASMSATAANEMQAEIEAERLQRELRQLQLERQLWESQQSLWDSLVDPREAQADEFGQPWPWIGMGGAAGSGCVGPRDESELEQIRAASREAATRNEFALSGLENRVNYVVGTGHRYTIVARAAEHTAVALRTQEILDRFLKSQVWGPRQQEIMRRLDRDGECFLRFFPVSAAEGLLAVRFIEPGQIATPGEERDRAEARFGILTDPHDAEQVHAFAVDGSWISSREIQHRKANVDRNTRRGLPTLFPILPNLQRVEKLLRNMSILSQTQAAIAVIRKHRQSSAGAVQSFVDSQASVRTAAPGGGTLRAKRLSPGTILDAPAGIDYEFPSLGVDAGRLVQILQAELRAIAARLVMPEFMLSADASNANYASTLVAEGPAVKMFQRLQASLIADDQEVWQRLLARAAAVGELPPDIADRVRLQTEPPSLVVRDHLAETQANAIKAQHGVLSRRTWQLQAGLDPAQENHPDNSGAAT